MCETAYNRWMSGYSLVEDCFLIKSRSQSWVSDQSGEHVKPMEKHAWGKMLVNDVYFSENYKTGKDRSGIELAIFWHLFQRRSTDSTSNVWHITDRVRVAEWMEEIAAGVSRLSARGCGFEPHRRSVTRPSPTPGGESVISCWTMDDDSCMYWTSEIKADMGVDKD